MIVALWSVLAFCALVQAFTIYVLVRFMRYKNSDLLRLGDDLGDLEGRVDQLEYDT